MTNDSRSQDTFSAVAQQLATLEKRDWELWIIVCFAGVMVAIGLLALIAPAAFMKQDEVHLTDPLTEVYNRRSLEDIAGRFISHARRLQNALTFMLIDVDRFKQVNTRFGNLTGDFVLAEVATLLRSSVRGSDAVVRYGGDEFLIILADTGALGASRVVQRIRKYLLDWNGSGHLEDFELDLSVGISEWSDGTTLDEVLDAADRAMYAEKASATSRGLES